MARKFDLISELYERTCFAVTDNPVNWQSFLKTAGRNFRLRFDEQLLIYAQRPDATAVLEIERWNGTFGRWVNRGAKGIAVFEDADRSRQRLIHYFDISDTHESRYSRPVPIWEMRPEFEAEVIETLENTFGAVNDTTSIENVVKESIANAVEDNIADYISDFMSLGAGSDIEYLSADEANALYLELVRNSVSYMVMARLGLDADKVYSPDDFAGISNFNSQEVLNAVGIATSDIAEMALLPVSRTISTLSKENRIIDEQEQSEYNKDIKDEKARLTNMIKSGKELKVFSIPNKDLKKFTEQAKRYGVLYCVLRDKNTRGDNVPIDIIARAEDASKIQRIVERFELGKVDKAAIVTESQKAVEKREAVEKDKPTKSKNEIITEEAVRKPLQKEENAQSNPTTAKTDKNPPSRQNSEPEDMQTDKGIAVDRQKKPSVKEKLDRYKAQAKQQKEAERKEPETDKAKRPSAPKQTVHQQPKTKSKKPKER